MSLPDTNNPFAPPAMTAPQGSVQTAGYPSGIEYLRSYNYIFENPNWAMNVLWGFLCLLSTSLIPVLGQLVFLGYQFEIVQVLLMTGGTRYPDFDLNRFGDYLGRAIWPFLVQLIFTIPLVIAMYIGMFVVFVLAALAAAAVGDDAGAVVAVLVGGAGMIGLVTVFIGLMALMVPMILRAGLQQDFAAAFDFGWAIGFLKKMWIEVILTGLFMALTGWVLMMVGLLALCVGAFAGMALALLAQSHLWYQLYLVYLGRGGKPIPIKPLTPMTPPQPQRL